jgi:glycosyltransferase involved in cell wall biosynthesis
MHRNLKISIVIPCYNEADGIRAVIQQIPDYVDEIVVVDNRSTDGTGEVAQSLGARVVFEGIQGYGAAYKTGLPAATGDIIATLDGDGTYPAEEISRLVDLLEDRGYDFISASRFPLQNPEAMPLTNQLGNRVLTITTRVLFGHPIVDSQSGMWVFRRSVLEKLRLTSNGMPLSEEIKLEALSHPEVRFHEAHIPYYERIGEVKLRRWREGFENLLFLVRKRFGWVS